MDVGRTVRRWRRQAGLSQGELAAAVGTRQPQIARIERGRQSPRLDTLQAILAACGAELRAEARRRPADPPPPPARPLARGQGQVLALLALHKVRCAVVGPLAERLRGADIPAPETVTIVAERERINHRKLTLVRRKMGLPLRKVAPLRVRFEGYEELAPRAAPTTPGGPSVASLADLIEARRTPTKPEARQALELLLRIREAERAAERDED